MKPKVLIVIPCINLWTKYTKSCIESIESKYEFKILLIDNASTDETKDEATKLVSDKFSYIFNSERFSCAESWNQGINLGFETGFDYVLVLNNDVLLHPLAIDTLVERFEQKDPNILMISSVDVRNDIIHSEMLSALHIDNYKQMPEQPLPNFSSFMINRECWCKIGAFDENFRPCYFEDNDYHRRIRIAGCKAICLPTSLFYHFGSKTQNEAIDRPLTLPTQFIANRDYYIKKWGGMPEEETFDEPFNEI